uniref:Reverse transcriptase domain-containing protein n=1 Tax=Angiostrongylus cantonensis TaxID=6313 RepID=A0A0K0DL72_ANGCA
MELKIDGWLLHHLCFAEDIALITPNISEAERMFADFDKACRKIALRLNLTRMMSLMKGMASYASFTLNGANNSECSSYVYVDWKTNMMSNLAPELSGRKRVAYTIIEDVVRKTKNIRLQTNLFDLTCFLR